MLLLWLVMLVLMFWVGDVVVMVGDGDGNVLSLLMFGGLVMLPVFS